MEIRNGGLMPGNGPLYDGAARAAAQIINLHLGSGDPKHVLFAKILFLILDAMHAAEDELNEQRYKPSNN